MRSRACRPSASGPRRWWASSTGAVQAAREARTQADVAGRGIACRVAPSVESFAESARREAARVGAELAAANQFLSSHARFGAAGAGGAQALSETLTVADGYELALAAALGGRLDAALVRDLRGANTLLDGAGPDGASALLAGDAAERETDAPVPGGQGSSLDLDLDLGSGPVPGAVD